MGLATQATVKYLNEGLTVKHTSPAIESCAPVRPYFDVLDAVGNSPLKTRTKTLLKHLYEYVQKIFHNRETKTSAFVPVCCTLPGARAI